MPGTTNGNGHDLAHDAALPPHVAVVSTTDTAARAVIAAKLKLAAKIPVNKLLNSSSASSSSSSRVGAKSKRTERKLLHMTPEQWSAYEKTPPYAKVVPTARILPIRCPLSSLYVPRRAAVSTTA